MKRYYYDCPIKAVYMAKYHGMKFYCINSDESMQEYDLSETDREFPFGDLGFEYSEINMWGEVIEESKGKRKIYLHPDSYPLLLPRVEDLVTNTPLPFIWLECEDV